MKNTNTIIAEALLKNFTVKNHKDATINGGQVGVDIYGKWDIAIKAAHECFYTYQHDVVDVAIAKSASVDTTRAMNALQELLDLIGEVNGHAITKNSAMLEMVSKHAIKSKEDLVGRAMTIASELKNLRSEYNNLSNGVNPEYVEKLEKDIADKEAELKLEKSKPDSAKKFQTRTSLAVFRYNVERALAEIISKQSTKTWEELEAEAEALRAKRRAATKAKRAAQKAEAEAKAKAETAKA